MSPKRMPLTAALTTPAAAASVSAEIEEPAPAEGARPARRSATKAATIQQTVYLPPAVHDQLRKIAFDERVKMHDILLEGLDLAFERRGLPTIAGLIKDQ